MDCCVIGIGTFGFNVAKTLVEAGNKVLAIDSDISAIRSIKDIATNSICLKVFDFSRLLLLCWAHAANCTSSNDKIKLNFIGVFIFKYKAMYPAKTHYRRFYDTVYHELYIL